MPPIEIYYHYFLPPDLRADMWAVWLNENLGLLRDSKLAEIAKVYICITGPLHWVHMTHTNQFHRSGEPDTSINFLEAIKCYINARFPFVEILDVRDISEPSEFEGHTLKHLHRACQERDIDVLYIHNKGVCVGSPFAHNWREVLQFFCIKNWMHCVKNLRNYDVVGITDNVNKAVISGNIWWARAEYIRTLPEPLDSTKYIPADNQRLMPGGLGYRYAFEHWIVSSVACNVFFLYDTNTNHYQEYCFIEDIIKSLENIDKFWLHRLSA